MSRTQRKQHTFQCPIQSNPFTVLSILSHLVFSLEDYICTFQQEKNLFCTGNKNML